jgi:hypothetical protein
MCKAVLIDQDPQLSFKLFSFSFMELMQEAPSSLLIVTKALLLQKNIFLKIKNTVHKAHKGLEIL